jgi:hypothetical protein
VNVSDCTTRHRRRIKGPGGCPPRTRQFRNLDSIVRDYIESHREHAREELSHFRHQPDLRSAIRMAALALNSDNEKHGHQWRIPCATLKAWRTELSRKTSSLQSCNDFEGLMKIARRVGKSIWGIGELTIYDTTHRIGAYMRMAPSKVYLHAGTREGAKTLGFNGNRAFIFPRELPRAFRKLKPYEIEDCLCRYKDDLRKLSARLICI